MRKQQAWSCGWCGAERRPGSRSVGCPRGPQCATDRRNHDELMDRIEDQGALEKIRASLEEARK